MSWADICQDPVLKDLPYKVQTDKWGNIVMSPASNEHGIHQAKIVALLSRLLAKGTIVAECSVQTCEGVKVADVAWASDEFMGRNRGRSPFDQAPELCIEILSPSNTELEMEEKRELYFARGAREFWLCDAEGNIRFFNETGPLENSTIVKDFPGKLAV
ncbi:MAG: Uma2 family endonuclease [Candidatus Competibacteraceae bacterium]|nr:Uma2 family endonuclease [Candidatus Competibacteraceae bacterium]